MKEHLKERFEKISKRITLCGSTKFKKEFEAINKRFSLEGHVVYTVSFFGHSEQEKIDQLDKEILDAVHLKKIDNSEGIFVINVDGYIGESTQNEIDYANQTGKFVKFLSDYPDLITLCNQSILQSIFKL
jgi:hypothetical protein